MDLDINIEELEVEELREFTQGLLRLMRMDADLIKTMREIIDLKS